MGPYGALVFTGNVSGAGTDEDAQLLISGQLFIGRVRLSGAGDALERGHDQIPDEYVNIYLNGSMLDALSCGVKLSQNGTANADWYCSKIIFYGADLGDLSHPSSANLAVIEVNDWIRYGEDYAYFEVKIVPAISYLLRPYATMTGPGRRVRVAQREEGPEVEPTIIYRQGCDA